MRVSCLFAGTAACVLKIVLDCGSRQLATKGGRSSADRCPPGPLDLQASGLAMVSPGGPSCQRQCQMPLCSTRCPATATPPPVQVLYGWAGRQAVPQDHARLSAVLLQIIREPTQAPPGPGGPDTHPPRQPDRPTPGCSRTVGFGRVVSQGGASLTGACDSIVSSTTRPSPSVVEQF